MQNSLASVQNLTLLINPIVFVKCIDRGNGVYKFELHDLQTCKIWEIIFSSSTLAMICILLRNELRKIDARKSTKMEKSYTGNTIGLPKVVQAIPFHLHVYWIWSKESQEKYLLSMKRYIFTEFYNIESIVFKEAPFTDLQQLIFLIFCHQRTWTGSYFDLYEKKLRIELWSYDKFFPNKLLTSEEASTVQSTPLLFENRFKICV